MMLFLPLFALGSLFLQQPSRLDVRRKGGSAFERQKTLGRILTKEGKPWGGVRVKLVSFPVFDQPFLGKADRLEVVSDPRGRFRVFLIPGRRYYAWGIGGKGGEGFRASSISDMVFARGRIQLKEGEEEAKSYKFQLGGRRRWKGDFTVIAMLKSDSSLAWRIHPDKRGVYQTPLLPGAVTVRVFNGAGLWVGRMDFPPKAGQASGKKGQGLAGAGVVFPGGGVRLVKILEKAKAVQKGAAKQAGNRGAKKRTAQEKDGKSPPGSKPKGNKPDTVGAPATRPGPKHEAGGKPRARRSEEESKETKESREGSSRGTKGANKEPEARAEEAGAPPIPPMVPGVTVLELDWSFVVKIKVRKNKSGNRAHLEAPGVRLRMLPLDKSLGLFDWRKLPPLTVTDKAGLGLLALPIPPGQEGRKSFSWKMAAESEGYCLVFPNIYRTVDYPKDPKSTRLKDSANSLTLTLFSRKGFTVKGRLLGQGGEPIAGRPLLLYTSRPSSANGWSHGRDPLFVGHTGKDGSFQVDNLDPRSTQALAVLLSEEQRASLGGGSPWLDPRAFIFFREDAKKKAEVFDLADFSLKDLHRFELRVSFLDDSPAPFTHVLAAETRMHPNGLIGMYYPIQGFTDRRGRFAMLFPDCETTIGVIGRDQRSSAKKVVMKGKAGAVVEEHFTLGVGRLLQGTVIDSDGKPFPGAGIYVNLYNSGRNQSGWIFSTFRANNTIKAGPKGRFKVRVPGGTRVYISARYKVGKRWYYSRGVQVLVEEDLDPDPLELQVPVEAPKAASSKKARDENPSPGQKR